MKNAGTALPVSRPKPPATEKPAGELPIVTPANRLDAPEPEADTSSLHTVHAESGPAPPPRLPRAATEKPADKPAKGGKDKGKDKGDEKPADKSAEKPADKSAEKAAEKAAEKEKAAPAEPGVTEVMFKEEAKKAEDREKAAEARHKALFEAVAKITAGVAALLETDDLEPGNVKKAKEAAAKRRADKAALAKKTEEFLQNIVKDTGALKKAADAEAKDPAKAPTVMAVLEQYKKAGNEQTVYLRKLGNEILDHNSSQHKATQDAAKQWARDQVSFNLSGYLDDFCKSIAGEVRSLLKEVGDLREQRRAMYM